MLIMIYNNILLPLLNKYKLDNISQSKINQLSNYISLIIQYNKLLKLTSDTSISKIVERHIIDSLQLLKINYISHCETIVDIGTGAGFPGIPLYIFTNKKIFLIESNEKKVIFLNIVKSYLKLNGLTIINGRAENLAHNILYREKFDCVISRALSNFSIAMELSFPFSKINGFILYYATKNTLEFIQNNFNRIKEYGCVDYKILEYKINNITYYLFYVQKLWKTPEKYPRIYKKIKQNML